MKIIFFLLIFTTMYNFPCACQIYVPTPEWYSDYDVKFYKLDIEADDTSADVKGFVEIIAEILVDELNRFTLELAEDLRVDSVRINGRKTMFSRHADLLYIHSPEPLSAGSKCSVRVYYAAIDVKSDGFFSAVSNKNDDNWDISATWTLSEPYNAKYWFPCKQYLPDKADSAHIFVTVPKNLKAGAPGVLTAITPMPDGKMRYEWKTRYPTAYYLLSFTVADYKEYTIYANPTGINKPVAVQNYIYNREGYLDENKAAIDLTAPLIELYSELFTPYPFADEKYGHCVAPMGGGMEHQTMTTISEFDFGLVAHELAHQWFGNLVTCATFQDIWINEGFSTYAEYLALERMVSPERAFAWLRQTHAIASWSQTGAVFVPAESAYDAWRIFNMGLSYKKGGLLVHKIRRIINDDQKFFEILRGFLQKYSFSVATGMEFKKYLEEQTGMDFKQFFEQWYFGEGYPIFDVTWKKGDGYIDLLVEHTGSAPATPLFITNLDVKIKRENNSDTLIQLPIRTNRDIFKIIIANDAKNIEIDPDYWTLKQLQSNSLVRDLPTNDNFVRCNTHIIRRQDLTIAFAARTARNCHIKLTDATGDKIFIEKLINRKREITIPMEQLPNATYMLYVQNGKNQYVRKILK